MYIDFVCIRMVCERVCVCVCVFLESVRDRDTISRRRECYVRNH